MPSADSSATSTTVDRAGALLRLLAQHPEGLGVTQLTRELNTQRAPLYRILRALIAHRLVSRDPHKRYVLGAGTLELARAYSSRLPPDVETVLAALANETGMTAMLISADDGAMTTVATRTPTTSAEHVYTPPGFLHPGTGLSMQVAIDALRPPRDDDPEETRDARRRGYAVGMGKVMPGRYGAAAVVPGSISASSALVLALASFRTFDADAVGEPLLRSAETIGFMTVGATRARDV